MRRGKAGRMQEVARAPLTFGQLSTWRQMQDLSPEHALSVNLIRAWRLPPGCRLESVRHALDGMQQSHESLRTGFSASGDMRIEQIIWDAPYAPVDVVEA